MYAIAAFDAAVIFVVVDGGWTRVDAVFTFGKNGFNIDSAGIKCLSTGCDWLAAVFKSNVVVTFVDGLFDWLLINVLLCVVCLPKLTAVARSRPPPRKTYMKISINYSFI